MTISVLIADDQTLARAGLRMLIESEPDMQVIGEATNGEDAISLAELHHPDVILMDVRMPVLDGLAATKTIGENPALAETRIIILTTFDTDDHIMTALRYGASGFLLKDFEAANLLQAIRTVHQGDSLLAASVTRRIVEMWMPKEQPRTINPLANQRNDQRDDQRLADLTDREREVLTCVARGWSNAEIAEHLFVTHATAKTHVSRILAKLGARDRVQLIIIGYETGLVSVS